MWWYADLPATLPDPAPQAAPPDDSIVGEELLFGIDLKGSELVSVLFSMLDLALPEEPFRHIGEA